MRVSGSILSFLTEWSIGKNILGGFLLLACLAAVAGITGILNIVAIGNPMGRAAHDEAPTADAEMEMMLAMAFTKDAMANSNWILSRYPNWDQY